MSTSDLTFETVAKLAERISRRELSPVTLVRACVERIESQDAALRTFIAVTAERALTDARMADEEIGQGLYRGPLHGIPYAVKDLCNVRGMPTTAGSRVLDNAAASRDATVVARLREAGAILLGKTNLHEMAFGPLGTNPHFGDVRNPWNPARHSGGSSSGSAAAVAAGFCPFSIGSDTTGSIRIPASFCGVVGLKPTYGRVSRAGAIPLAWSMDHFGPITRSVEDAAMVMEVIAGHDTNDASSSTLAVPAYRSMMAVDVAGMRLGLLVDCAEPLAADVAVPFRHALSVLLDVGLVVEEVRLPEVVLSAAVASAVLYPEALAYHGPVVRARSAELAADVRERFEFAGHVSGADYVNGQRVRGMLVDRVDELLARYDAIVCPTEPVTAPDISSETVEIAGVHEPKAAVVTRFTRLFNLTGHPAITVPCGFSEGGLPVGLQLIARHHAEATVLALAHAYEKATAWRRRVPSLGGGRTD